MTDIRLLGNQHVTVAVAPDNGIASWIDGPTVDEADAALNASGGINWDSFDFNVQASDSQDDRTLTDGAGAKSRGLPKFGGNIEVVIPRPDDTSSIYRETYNVFKGDRAKLATIVRVGPLNSTTFAAGDVVNAYHVLRDADDLRRADSNTPSYASKVNLLPQNDIIVNAILPSASPTAVTVTRVGSGNLTVGTPDFLKATYEGNNVTVGAKYVSSDETVVIVTPHGCVLPQAAGTATITATYPGSAAGTPLSVTVGA